MNAQRIVPNIWCNRSAAEAGAFYAASLPRTISAVGAHYPDSVPEFQAGFAGEVLTVDVSIAGYQLTLINAGDEFVPNPSISFMLNFDPLLFDGDAGRARAQLDETWKALAATGTVLMELGEYPFSPHYGWVQDRFGVSWQLIQTDPAGEPRPFVIPQLMFAGPAQHRALEAVEYYCEVFDDSGTGMIAEYPSDTGPADQGDVIFGELRLLDQWFSVMDSAVEHEFGFTPGVSLEVRCADQAEIDRYWQALSAVPEAEQCGWLADRFGVSWQIVPQNMGELMARPGAYERMLAMTKLVIAEF